MSTFGSESWFGDESTGVVAVTGAEWLRNTHIIACFQDGSILKKSLADPTQKAVLLHKENYNPIRDLILVSFNIIFALESGHVKSVPLFGEEVAEAVSIG